MTTAAIEIKNLRKDYRTGFLRKKITALSDLTLSVPAGSVFGFLGANGAGKTTTIKILMGLQFATSGTVRIFGKEINDLNAKEKIGYMPERTAFHMELTGNEFLNFHRSLFGSRAPQKDSMKNEELLELVGLQGVGGRLLREFSKGMLQRIGIAQSLVNSPELIVLDEPMSGLDPVGRREIRTLIYNLSQQGKTVFFSTHILSDAETLCDQIAFLDRGVLKSCGRLKDILIQSKSFSKEIIFEGVSDNDLNKVLCLKSAARFGTAWKVLAENQKTMREIIEFVWQKNGQIISISNPSLSLETVLFPEGEKQ